jgi:CubicO group peptidase (beta-lactamase class C family)
MIAAGLGLWVIVGVAAGLLARRSWLAPGASPGLTTLWAVLGAMVGGFAGLVPSLPEGYAPWGVGPLVGAAFGGFLSSLLYRLVAGRKESSRTSRRGALAAVLLMTGSGVLAWGVWYLLAVASPRLYNPTVNSDVERLLIDHTGSDTAALRARLEGIVEAYLSRELNAGIVIGISSDGVRMVVSGGVASKRNGGPPVDANSVFEIGSISKVFAGIGLAQAVATNEVSLDQQIGTLLPYGPGSSGDPNRHPITLGELATHSAGLPEYPASMPWWAALTSDNPYAGLTEEELEQSLSASAGAPREMGSYRYSSFGFILLAYLLEREAGVLYPHLLREHVFQPLGMLRTQVPVGSSVPQGLVEGHALGRPVPHWIGHSWAGAAGVVSTANDLLTFAESYGSPPGGLFGDALKLAGAEHGNAWGARKMGLGWHIIDGPESQRILYHSGSTLGSYAYLGVSPEAGVAVVVLTNSSDPTAASIGAGMMDMLAATKSAQTMEQSGSTGPGSGPQLLEGAGPERTNGR